MYDIYLELEGNKIAVVGSYQSQKIGDGVTYKIRLNRVYLTDFAIKEHINIYSIKDFSFIVLSHGKNIIYKKCNFSLEDTVGSLTSCCLEFCSIISTERVETLR